jgi:hypothetical protein
MIHANFNGRTISGFSDLNVIGEFDFSFEVWNDGREAQQQKPGVCQASYERKNRLSKV